ncbi:MAG: aldo/keto reductase [Chloroflexota bacterium]|nr:aldo/keto reductase [Chloroflexota bacterium]
MAASLERRTFGRTGLEVTALGYGAMEIRGPRIWSGRDLTDDQADRILNAVLDAGINFIDTAYDYGRSEEYIGRFISRRRDEYYLATKCGCTVVDAGDHDETPHVWTRENITVRLEESLRRMKTDYVDLLQLHNPSVEQVEQGDLVQVLKDLQAAGKTRWIGCSSTLPHLATYVAWGVFDAFQIPYSALERRHEEWISRASETGAGIIIRGGVARGAPDDAGLGAIDRWAVWEKASLDELRSPGESRTAFLLRYTLSHPGLDTTIVGTLQPEHLQQNIEQAMAGPLSPDIYAEAKRRLSAAGEEPER